MIEADQTHLRQLLASFDEAGLVALANKGLVRRAQKDLETGGLTHEETDEAILVHGPGWVVRMPPDGPARATDSTRATGITRQILTATIYLRDHWTAPVAGAPDVPAGTADGIEEALLALTMDDLQKWAGKTILHEALAIVRDGMPIEVEKHAGLTLRLVQHEIDARLMAVPGKRSARTLLDRILTTAPRTLHRRWVTVIVLAFWHSRGRPPVETVPGAPAEDAGTPRSRQQVLASTATLLENMVASGLAHPSSAMAERLFTLSIAAVAVHLPRLARLLRSLAEQVARVLARDAAADTSGLFDSIALTYALARALSAAGPHAPVALLGQQRTRYDPAGDLHLAGVGAYSWQTSSGYQGLTVVFWDEAGKRFLSWTASRPKGSPGRFDPVQVYRSQPAWSGSGAPENFSRRRFTLRQARVNPQGRLSGSEQSTAAEMAPISPAELDFGARAFTDWSDLWNYALGQYPLGLAESQPLDRLVVLQPSAWGERYFDEMQQRFCWPVRDEAGKTITLTLSWAGVHETAIEFLEAVHPERDHLSAILCRLTLDPQGMVVEPLVLYSRGTPRGHHVLNPAFDRERITSQHSGLLERLRAKYGRDRVTTVLTSEDEEIHDTDVVLPDGAPPGIRKRLANVELTLLQFAEAGLGRLDESARERLRRLASELERAGLRELGTALSALTHDRAAAALIWAGYLNRLHHQATRLERIALLWNH